ncbi:MAG TPA: adenylyl-sulfate kinase [Kiritimatiellia bacterium]|nr:adenylyl-sulfate kinase [Kiritimatiellia bacterium]
MTKNVYKSESLVVPEERIRVLGQRGVVVWFTGLSGSGKSTLAKALEQALMNADHPAFLLDGDNLRHGLCADLTFSAEHRAENVRRAAAVAGLMADAGLICITAFISPQRAAREAARQLIGPERFLEIHVSTPLSVCEKRDCKGLYARARAGEVREFTGISAPYEAPEHPDVAIDTSAVPTPQAIEQIIVRLAARAGWAKAPARG